MPARCDSLAPGPSCRAGRRRRLWDSIPKGPRSRRCRRGWPTCARHRQRNCYEPSQKPCLRPRARPVCRRQGCGWSRRRSRDPTPTDPEVPSQWHCRPWASRRTWPRPCRSRQRRPTPNNARLGPAQGDRRASRWLSRSRAPCPEPSARTPRGGHWPGQNGLRCRWRAGREQPAYFFGTS